ncbi:MlaD family protein (plasmid) [Aquabacterium sp. OR-4]|nr:MlaD family protein [Aquabacterium sp. OR-4]MDT7838312.1 MlaD family protein [Aquabacterium sp. OR-4]
MPPEHNAGLERLAGGLLLLLVALLAASALYLLYARGAFEPTQRLVLLADDSEGVTVGMDLTFSGFPIGRVRRIELARDGNVRILVDVPRSEAHWLRQSSVFTLSRGLVGGTALRAFSGILTDPQLPDGAERRVLAGDASAEVPKLVAAVRELVANLSALTDKDAALAGMLANAATLTGRLNEPRGALGVLMGNPADADKVISALNRSNALLARIDGLAQRIDGLAAKADSLVGHADAQVFGPQGLASEAQATVVQLRGLLGDARGTLQGVDKLLAEAQGVAANTRSATADLGPLRAELEASLRKLQGLVNELNRRWPLARDTELKLP